MAGNTPNYVDPRIRRTRLLLQEALVRLLGKKKFDDISVQDVTEEATVNRATFYAHYADKYALLECMTATRFLALLDERGVKFDGTCPSALRNMFLGIGYYLTSHSGTCSSDPHMESAMVAVIRNMVLDGLEMNSSEHPVSTPMVATTVSWAIYGAAKEWFSTQNRRPIEQIADGVVNLIYPLIHPSSKSDIGERHEH